MGVVAAIASVVSGISQYAQGQQNARSLRNQAEINEIQNEFQGEMLDIRKKELLEQGEERASLRQQQLRRLLGAQKLSFAAQNVDVEGDLGESLADDSKRAAEADVKAIRNNAWKQAMGIEMDQMDLELNSRMKNLELDTAAKDAEARGRSGAVQSFANAYGGFRQSGFSFGSMFSLGDSAGPTDTRSAYNYNRRNFNRRLS